MTIGNPARLAAAQRLVARFKEAGRPGAVGKPPKKPSPKHLQALQRSPQRWPVTRDALVAQLTARLGGRSQPSQVGTSYCGPAAFLYCLLEDRPDLYVAYAISLWAQGGFDFGSVDVDIDPGTVESLGQIQAARSASPGKNFISELDWMTMAGLSASTRPWFVPGEAAGPDDEGKSITYPWVLKRWFAAVGSRPVYDCMGLGAVKQGLPAFVVTMNRWSRNWLVLQIDSSLLNGGEPNTIRKRHWVVVNPHHQPRIRRGDGKVVPLGSVGDQFKLKTAPRAGTYLDASHMLDWQIEVPIVTWGVEAHKLGLTTLGALASRFYGAFAFPRLG